MSLEIYRIVSKAYKQKKAKKKIREFISPFLKQAAQGAAGQWADSYRGKTYGIKVHAAIREHLTNVTRRCGYCQDKLFHNANVNVDHILPAAKYPQFTFTPRNLVAACVTCNAIKSDLDLYQVSTSEKNYSKHIGSFKSFHPRIDKYNDHIRMISVHTNYIHVRAFIGKSQKGKHICEKFLKDVSEFGTKAPANPSIAQAVISLQSYLSSSANGCTPALRKLLSKLLSTI